MRRLRPAVLLSLLCCLGPLAAPSAAIPKATSAVSFKEVSGINAEFRATGNAIFRERTGQLHAHVILSAKIPLERASVEIVAGRCGEAPGRTLAIDVGTIPAAGANLTADVATHLSTLGLPHAQSVRIVSDGTEITCAPPLSLLPAAQGRRKPTVTVSDFKPVGTGGLYGITITQTRGGKGRHMDVLTVHAPKDIAGVRAAPRARAAFTYQKITCVMMNQQGMTIASWRNPFEEGAQTQYSWGVMPDGYRAAPARKLQIKGDGKVVARAPARRYAVAG
jgi:hypothetical protein